MIEWVWLKAKRAAISPADRDYRNTVTANKQKAARKRHRTAQRAEAKRIRALNDEPLY